MYTAIFLFFSSVLLFSTNIHICILSRNDVLKCFIRIGRFYFLIPHHKLIYNLLHTNINFKKIKKRQKITLAITKSIFSHSIIDELFIAKAYNKNNIFENTLFYIISGIIIGLSHQSFRIVENDNIRLKQNPYYENIDYKIEVHSDVIKLLCALISGLRKGLIG